MNASPASREQIARTARTAWLDSVGLALHHRVADLISRGYEPLTSPRDRDRLALDLFAWQRSKSPAIDRIARAFAGDTPVDHIDQIPGVPTDAFKSARISCFSSDHDIRVFRTSGTTQEIRGEHVFADTSLYVAGAEQSARRDLLPRDRYRFVLLAERENDAPHSSLSFMLARFFSTWSNQPSLDAWMIDSGALDINRVRAAIEQSQRDHIPIAMLGASFAFVHWLDALAPSERYALPLGSVVMPTGGFKGRSREIAPEALFSAICERTTLRRTDVIQEYGMTELSSQAYERHAETRVGRYVAPPWMIVSAVNPETLAPLPNGTEGVLRVLDLANVGSSIAIQTADRGATFPDGFEVYGRVLGATPRGCARAIDALLSAR